MELPTTYQQFVHLSRYARWVESEGRRETWEETVDRYMDHMCDVKCRGKIDDVTRGELRNGILNLEVMPSMRCMMSAGPALERDEVAGYNCSAVKIDHPVVFDEILFLLMCGVGVGFSVERQFICGLPVVAERFYPSPTVIKVEDSKIGWCDALRELIGMLYSGRVPKWNVDDIRPAGSRLKTFGGRASGPQPLVDLFGFVVRLFEGACGRRLTSIECHDLVCKIADAVVVGGVRRSATLSLSNPSDDRMRHAKSGDWYKTEPQRALANISSAYTEKPSMDVFFREWFALFESKSGERGIFNREAALVRAAELGRSVDVDYGLNPCGEILLNLEGGLCNLSEVVVRPDDDESSLRRKARLATILGTMQATLVDFRYLRDVWRRNAEEEALLGVSLTGIFDNPLMYTNKRELGKMLERLREGVVSVNAEWAEKLGVNRAAAVTCVKPSGTVGQLCSCSSGIHPRYAKYYVRRVRAAKNDPLARMMVELGVPCEDDVTKPDNNWVFSFAHHFSGKTVVSKDLTAIRHLEIWRVYRKHWCHHNPSCTVELEESDWMEVGAWVYKHFDEVGGITFFPRSTHSYVQAPYGECSEDEYERLAKQMPRAVDWSRLREFETEDHTAGPKSYACTGEKGACEVVDLV